MAKFRVVSGKHQNKEGEFVYQGDTIEMSEAEAAKFPNKFAKIIEEAPAAPTSEGEGDGAGKPEEGKPAGKPAGK